MCEEDAPVTVFVHGDILRRLLSDLVSLSVVDRAATREQEAKELGQVESLCGILNEYQEQSHLLAPQLHELLDPLISTLRPVVHSAQDRLSSRRVQLVARLVYFISKVAGAKAIVRFFPHEVTDLVALVGILRHPVSLQDASWELRYTLLLWLSVACRVPFDLDRLRGGAQAISLLAQHYLALPSKERDGAIVLLGSFYTRRDSNLSPLLGACEHTFGGQNQLLTSAMLQVLCQVLKNGQPHVIVQHWTKLYRLLAVHDSARDATIDKARIKLAGRLALLKLTEASSKNAEVPGEVEVVLSEMMLSLEAEDTVVRWSAAKYIARISELLPRDFASDIVEAILARFESGFDELDKAENVLQGACFAFGELVRRRQLHPAAVERLISCVLKALAFDRKRGAQSVGSAVRDSAAYVLWSFARTIDSATLGSANAELLAMKLACVAVSDREVHVRRAASAAYQECAGRWGTFPHGIDVLRKIDFLTVGVRKRAFLEAAPAIAVHAEYRAALLDHLINTTSAHYDPVLRILAASTVEALIRLEPSAARPVARAQTAKLSSKDPTVLHSALLLSGAVARGVQDVAPPESEAIKSEIFGSVAALPLTTRAARGSLVLAAAFDALGASCTTQAIENHPQWLKLFDAVGNRSDDQVFEAAAAALERCSACANLTGVHEQLVQDTKSTSPSRQQWAALALGRFTYHPQHQDTASRALQHLASLANDAGQPVTTVEARRNALESIGLILSSESVAVESDVVHKCWESIFRGFNDYSVDQRGDVGSWIRLASVSAVRRILARLTAYSMLDQATVDKAIAACLKQAMERLDSVREVAGLALTEIIAAPSFINDNKNAELLQSRIADPDPHWRDATWAAERLLPLLRVPEYRSALLEGAVLSTTHHAANPTLLEFASDLPLFTVDGLYSLKQLVDDLVNLAQSNFTSNRLMIGTLSVLGSLLETGCLEDVEVEENGAATLQRMLKLSTRSLLAVKNPSRLTAITKIVVRLLGFDSVKEASGDAVKLLLTHPTMPWLRQSTAEELLGVYGEGGGEDSELEAAVLNIPWSNAVPSQEQIDLVLAMIKRVT